MDQDILNHSTGPGLVFSPGLAFSQKLAFSPELTFSPEIAFSPELPLSLFSFTFSINVLLFSALVWCESCVISELVSELRKNI